MNPPKIKIMNGNPGVTQVSGVVQYSAVSELCITMLSLFLFPIFFSKEKQYFGFLDLYPKTWPKLSLIWFPQNQEKYPLFLKLGKNFG